MDEPLFAPAVVFLVVTARSTWFRHRPDSIVADQESQVSLPRLRKCLMPLVPENP